MWKQADQAEIFQIFIALFVQQSSFRILPDARDSVLSRVSVKLGENYLKFAPTGCAIIVKNFTIFRLEDLFHFADQYKEGGFACWHEFEVLERGLNRFV